MEKKNKNSNKSHQKAKSEHHKHHEKKSEKKYHKQKHHEKKAHKHKQVKTKQKFEPGKASIIIAMILLFVVIVLMLNISKFTNGTITKDKKITEKNDPNVLAIVNGEKIYKEDINKQMEMISSSDEINISKEEVLDQTIERKILVQEAKKEGFEIDKDESKEEVEKLLNNAGFSVEELEKEVEGKNISMDFIFKIFRERLMAIRLINETVLQNIKVSQEEIDAFYKKKGLESRTDIPESQARLMVESNMQNQEILKYIQQLKNNSEIQKFDFTDENTPIITKLTFNIHEGEICKEQEKPVIRLFSTTSCPHCSWISSTFDNTVKKYVQEGKIVAYHWNLDNNDNTLTDEKEIILPEKEMKVYQQFSPNGYVPTFVFGCKYYRIGNGYESQGDGLEMEKAEFKKIIEKLIKN